jgi:hypothetical protein
MAGKTSLKAMKKKKSEVDEATSGDFFTAKEGDNELRILPPWRGNNPFMEVEQHSATVKGRNRPFTCPLSRGKKFCYTCEVVIPELEGGDQEDQKVADELAPSKRVYANVLYVTHNGKPTGRKEPQIWGFSFYRTYGQILTYFNDPEYGDITDVDEGTNLILNRKGTGFTDTEYSLRPKRESSKLPPGVINKLHDLDEIFKACSTEDQKKIMKDAYGLEFEDTGEEPPWDDDDDSDEDDADEAVTSDSAQDDEEEESEEEEVEEKPKKRGRPPKKKEEPKEEEEGTRTAIKLDKRLKGMNKKKALDKAKKESECFGSLFSDDADECEGCAAMIDCVVATEEGDD